MNEKKRRHHYVYQRYLSAWTVNDQLWFRRDGKILPSATINVAQKRDFYRLRPVNRDEVEFTLAVIAKGFPSLQQAILNHMNAYLEPIKWQEQLMRTKAAVESKFGGSANVPREITDQIKSLEDLAEIAVNNTDEEYYSDIEGESLAWLDALKAGDTSFYYNNREDVEQVEALDDEAYHFLYFVSVQYFRTKAMRDRWIADFHSVLSAPNRDRTGIVKDTIHPENLTAHIFWVFQGMMAFRLRKKDAPLSLLINETSVPFVTSDQPVINLKADYQKPEEIPEDLILYYPISPNSAIILNDCALPRKLRISEAQAEIYNKALIRASHEFVFANTKDILHAYQDVFPDTTPSEDRRDR